MHSQASSYAVRTITSDTPFSAGTGARHPHLPPASMRPTRNGVDCNIVFLVRFLVVGEFQVRRGYDEDGGGVRAPGQIFTLQQSEKKVWK